MLIIETKRTFDACFGSFDVLRSEIFDIER